MVGSKTGQREGHLEIRDFDSLLQGREQVERWGQTTWTRAPGECVAAALSPYWSADQGAGCGANTPASPPLPQGRSHLPPQNAPRSQSLVEKDNSTRKLSVSATESFLLSGGHGMAGGQRCHLRPHRSTKFHISQTRD